MDPSPSWSKLHDLDSCGRVVPGKRGNRTSGIVTKIDISGKRLPRLKERWKDSARHAVQDAAGLLEFGEALFFFAKVAGMRNQSAAGAAGGMLDVQHLVIKDILYGALRNAGAIHAAIQQNLIGPGIVTAKLPPPTAPAP
jgi:hypothetical protein